MSAESNAMLEQVKKFSLEVMRPAGISLDKLSDPADVIAPDSVLVGCSQKVSGNSGCTPRRFPNIWAARHGEADPLASASDALNSSAMPMPAWPSAWVCASRTFYLASLFPQPDMQQLARDYL
ncbi:MAG: hypothetical protein MZU91_14240 [Desulfosudis oleivorans]|nr:hypothetical protein [Desulfosudis oleivorans]